MEKVLVLGGGGFVGSAILRALARDGGLQPVSGVRQSRHGVAWEQRICDATDRQALARALEGVGSVVNAVLGSPATMLAVTGNLAAFGPGLRRIVHISTMSVYGDATGLVDEAAPLVGGHGYGGMKTACEALLAASMAAGQTVILRPGIVYAPGGEQWIGRIGRMLREGRLGDLGAAGAGRCNLIHADDVGGAVLAALRRPEAAGQAFNLATPSPPRWNEFFVSFARAIAAVPVPRIGTRRLMLETRVLAAPLQIAKLVGARLGLAAGRLPKPMPASLLALFGQDITLDHRRADALLGFARTDDAAGLAECAVWFEQNYRFARP